jgi:hypothetical protein
MSAERTEELSEPRVSRHLPVSVSVAVTGEGQDKGNRKGDGDSDSDATPSHREASSEHAATSNEVSLAKVGLQNRLPALDDDAQIGVQKEHIVTRDGKADLLFTGVLLASAAPALAPKGRWQEYRIYQTNGDKHVFSKVTRTVLEKEDDTCEAEVFDPSPSSVPSQLIRSAREIARAKPLTWMDAAVGFFGYDPLAKALYRKLSVRFEEQIS